VSGGLFEPEANDDLLYFEKRLFLQGYLNVAGIDEAGRGALAGPVVAAAVVFPEGIEIAGIDDSKKLTPSKRESLFSLIMEKSLAVNVGIGEYDLIDEVNILQATLLSMKKAVLGLPTCPDYLLVDGNCSIPVNIPQKAIIKGDSISFSIAAASIIAKVTRDRLMVEFDEIYPGYGFADHKGYGCASHLAAIAELGPCEIHRKTFRGVREFVKNKIQDSLFIDDL
jgi:ribonuclease HII